MIKCIFSDVSERDMDLLFLEEFAYSKEFVYLFTNIVNESNPHIISIQQSKVDSEYGESDMTVIADCDGVKVGFLIEDKIDAIAMPRQCKRYFLRGEKGIKNGYYDRFHVFIVAPEKYLSENNEAQHYPNQISYESVLKYYKQYDDARSQFKAQQIEQAIYKQKHGYQVIENTAVSEFWDKYIAYQKKHYSHLYLVTGGGKKGSAATWPHYNTRIKGVYLSHKSEKGYIDLTFSGAWDRVNELESVLRKAIGQFENMGITLQQAGKSAALRFIVPVVDVHKPFEDQTKKIEECFKGIDLMTKLSHSLLSEDIAKLVK